MERMQKEKPRNPNLDGYIRCSYCKKYIQEGNIDHPCYRDRMMLLTAHGKHRVFRKIKDISDNETYVKYMKDNYGKF
jgi:hypothetical protein